MLIPSGMLLISGTGMLAAPVHMQMTGVVLLLLGVLIGLWECLFCRLGTKGQNFMRILALTACAGVIVLTSAMSLITSAGKTDWPRAEKAEYAVVLGAAVREDGKASRIMLQRLRAAKKLVDRNPDVTVILSGGQGGVEPKSEAECMYETLLEMGMDEARLLMEPNSQTTRENLSYSLEIIRERGGTDRPVALITSEFHLRRAIYIGKTLGIDACPVAARTDQWFYRINYTLREVFAFVKAAVQGNLD